MPTAAVNPDSMPWITGSRGISDGAIDSEKNSPALIIPEKGKPEK